MGHNPHSAKALKEEIKCIFNTKIILIYNCYQDKDAFLVLEILKPVVKKVLILELHNERIIQLEKLKGILETLGLEYALFEDLEENENYLVYGSFLVANAFYKRYQKKRD